MKVRLFAFSFWILVLVLLFNGAAYSSSSTNDHDILSLIKGMSPEQKAGQFLMLGISEDRMSPSLKKFLLRTQPGFIILFKRNIKTPRQTSELTYSIQNLLFNNNKISTALAVDQEGGDVVRIPTNPTLPTALAMGKSRDEKSITAIAQEIGKSLRLLGISINLAPVLDIAASERDSFIQTRSFGNKPELVALMAKNFSIGLNQANVAATAKHFPGLGSSENDTHKSAVISNFTEKEIKSFLTPYRELINKNAVQAIMLTHLIYPNLDPDKKPATFSPVISKLARDIGFEGVIMTDDVEMAGAKIYKSPGKRAIESFKAGSDVVMVAWNKSSQIAAHKSLVQAIVSGEISEERVHDSLERILKLKKQLGLLRAPNKPLFNEILAQINNPTLEKNVENIFNKIFFSESKKLDKVADNLNFSKVAVLSNSYSFYKNLKKEFPFDGSFYWSINNDLSRKLSSYSLIIFHSTGPKAARVLNSLSPQIKSKTLVLNSSYPGSVDESQFLEVLQFSMKHPKTANYLGKWFTENNAVRLPAAGRSAKNP